MNKDKFTIDDIVDEKLSDAMTPGVAIPMTKEEAELAGAFEERALTLRAAWESAIDIDIE